MRSVLAFSCLSAVLLLTVTSGAQPVTEKVRLLKTLIQDLTYLEKSKDRITLSVPSLQKIHLDLYTPAEKQECTWQTLQCYLAEMGTLDNEIEEEDINYLQNIKKNLQRLMDLIPSRARCKICEANDKKNFPAFHQELTNFLRSLLK